MTAEINLLPKQTEAWNFFEDPIVTEVGYGGAAGGGKTRVGCYLALHIALTYPGSRGAIARKELKVLRLTTLAEMFIIFNELDIEAGRDYKYNQQDNVITFSNGSEILLLDTAVSHQDPEYTRFGSLNLTWAWCEESNETPEKAKTILKTRVGRHNKINGEKVKSFWLETFNPNKGHVYRDYYRPWKENELPEYRRFVRALPGDNPHLPEQYILNLQRSDKVTRERLLKGNFDYDDDPLRLFNYDYLNDLKTNTINVTTPRYLICDVARFGGDKIVMGLFDGLELYGLHVYQFQGIDQTIEQIQSIAREEQVPFSHILIDEDGVGGGVVDGLRGVKGFMGGSTAFPLQTKSKMSLIASGQTNSNFRNLRSQCYFTLADYVNEHRMAVRLRVFKTNVEGFTDVIAVEQLIEELDVIKQTELSGDTTKLSIISKKDIKEDLGRSPDFADVMMMRMRFELQPEHVVQLQVNRINNAVERERNIKTNSR